MRTKKLVAVIFAGLLSLGVVACDDGAVDDLDNEDPLEEDADF